MKPEQCLPIYTEFLDAAQSQIACGSHQTCTTLEMNRAPTHLSDARAHSSDSKYAVIGPLVRYEDACLSLTRTEPVLLFPSAAQSQSVQYHYSKLQVREARASWAALKDKCRFWMKCPEGAGFLSDADEPGGVAACMRTTKTRWQRGESLR